MLIGEYILNMDDIGFSYAILVPNILTKSVRVTVDNSPQPLFYRNEEFLELVIKYGFLSVKSQIYTALSRTQSVMWDVKAEAVTPLNFRREVDSIKKDIIGVKKSSETEKEELSITERFSKTEINLDDPNNPVFKLF